MGMRERDRQKKIREYVINRDGSICCYCDKLLDPPEITLEHIVPGSKRGTFNSTNLTVACYPCNNRRGNRPFFEFIESFNFDEQKLAKYRKMYFDNLRIKILNIAKEECLISEEAVPNELVIRACDIMKIKQYNFADYENVYQFEINFNEVCNRKRIKYAFEQLIRLIEGESG